MDYFPTDAVADWDSWLERTRRRLMHWPQLRSHLKDELSLRCNDEARLSELIVGLEQLVVELDRDVIAAEILVKRVRAGKEGRAVRRTQRRLDARSAAAVQLINQAQRRVRELRILT